MKKIIFILCLFLISGCDKVDNCSNCVYSYYEDTKKIGDKLTEYEEDYKKVDSDIFLGHTLDNESKIIVGYICGVESGKLFCVTGNTDKTTYDKNKKILNKIYDSNQCKEEKNGDDSFYRCEGDNLVSISNNGSNYVGKSKSHQCYISEIGSMYCYSIEN